MAPLKIANDMVLNSVTTLILGMKPLAYSIMGKTLIQGNFDAMPLKREERIRAKGRLGCSVQCASFVVMQCVLELVC